LKASGAVQKGVQTFGEIARSSFGFQGISDGHLLEREQKICARLNSDSFGADLQKSSLG
jgi:hypothetical protein